MLNVLTSSCTVPVILIRFQLNLNFLDKFSKNTMKCHEICPMGAELFHANGQTDRQTDMTKLIVAFSSFTNAPKTHMCNLYYIKHM